MKKSLGLAWMAGLWLSQSSVHAVAADEALPLGLALQAAEETLRVCEAAGYRVSVSVVDLAGQAKVLLKGDGSTPHTQDTAYRKAYSVVTFGCRVNQADSLAVEGQLRGIGAEPSTVDAADLVIVNTCSMDNPP